MIFNNSWRQRANYLSDAKNSDGEYQTDAIYTYDAFCQSCGYLIESPMTQKIHIDGGNDTQGEIHSILFCPWCGIRMMSWGQWKRKDTDLSTITKVSQEIIVEMCISLN